MMALRALFIVAAVTASVHGVSAECISLGDYLDYYKQYSIMGTAFKAIPTLMEFAKLDAMPAEPFTVLLPTDNTINAFLPVLNMTLEELVADPQLLEAVVRTHIIRGSVPKDVADGTVFKTTLSTQPLKVSRLEDDICFSAWSYACIKGNAMDVCQGKVQQVNSVIVPENLDAEAVGGAIVSVAAIAG